ncbi:hypothetical protein PG911_05350 [Tenacibaculum ovolyticum]|uniref:hypothetical protein n=1 Tax=Tenacibaculum ovolyticum TaxID=104270 RepID=UPI0022F3C928|nr:hypothetical protein [Tenacibaculum ovolyticum]WBX77685.1 hypothetical protein PG911_05350 [Tenacibaculum ovolyticum]
MNKLSKQLILLLTIISLNIFAQVKLEANQLKMSYKWDVKYPFKISNIDSSKLSPNDYIITHRDKKGLGFILLSIDDNNNIKNPIVIKNNQREIIAKLYLESSNIIKRELFNTYSNQLEEEKKF